MMMRFEGIINTIERRYKHYRQEQTAHTEIETYLKRVMVEHTCPIATAPSSSASACW